MDGTGGERGTLTLHQGAPPRHAANLLTLAAGLFSGLSPLDEEDICLSRDWLLLGQSGLDDIMLPEAGRGG